MKKMSMTAQILVATVLGVILGIVFGERMQSVRLVGDIFLRLIQMNIVLLVLGHVVEAVGSINPRSLGRLGIKTFTIFITSSLCAASWGVLMGTVFQPGSGTMLGDMAGSEVVSATVMSVTDTILGFISPNILGSMAQGTIVHVILFGILFGIAAGAVAAKQEDRRFLDLVTLFNKTIIKLVSGIMKIAPLGICALLASTVGKLGIGIIIPLAKYLAVYGMATLIFLIAWLVLVSIRCGVSFPRLVRNVSGISMMALATTSSAVTLPTTLRDSEEKIGISRRLCQFVLPLGMSLNCNGAAMHMAITIITISQIYGVQYGPGQIVYIIVLATMSSMANAVVPGAGLVSLSIVIPAMGLPLESIALFASVDWFVGMLRTILNVDADVFTAMLLSKKEGELDKRVFYGQTILEPA
ncbi:MAG: dicarboxylate/amino acid:cation symporter [Planctomycetaceae bacterium]|nr:dicarboxylate/amino acid:cation symporter [Planctomycetaceae bacterium]